MRAALTHRIVIQRQVVGEDALGQPSGAWVTHATVWADVRWPTGQAAGREGIIGGVEAATMPCSVVIRRRGDITPGMRVTYEGISMDVEAVSPTDRSRGHMFLICKRVH